MEKGMMAASFTSICRSISAETAANGMGGAALSVSTAAAAAAAVAAADNPSSSGAVHEGAPSIGSAAQKAFASPVSAARCANYRQNSLSPEYLYLQLSDRSRT